MIQLSESHKRKPGGQTDPRREALIKAFGIKPTASRRLDEEQLDQLMRCRDNDARRLLLKPLVAPTKKRKQHKQDVEKLMKLAGKRSL
jgi:hypothetical protein